MITQCIKEEFAKISYYFQGYDRTYCTYFKGKMTFGSTALKSISRMLEVVNGM